MDTPGLAAGAVSRAFTCLPPMPRLIESERFIAISLPGGMRASADSARRPKDVFLQKDILQRPGCTLCHAPSSLCLTPAGSAAGGKTRQSPWRPAGRKKTFPGKPGNAEGGIKVRRMKRRFRYGSGQAADQRRHGNVARRCTASGTTPCSALVTPSSMLQAAT